MMVRRLALLALPILLIACGGPAEPRWAPDTDVARFDYQHGAPYSITLYTATSADTGGGMHSGLMINAPSRRVLFDPAGTFKLPFAPERNDVHYGVTENVRKVYIDYHARETIDMQVQEVMVSPEQAEAALRAATSYGAVPKAQCSFAVTRVLKQVPGWENMRISWFPNSVMRAFERKTGVAPVTITDDDADKNHNVLFGAAQDFAEGRL